jgi:hypothetical protein
LIAPFVSLVVCFCFCADYDTNSLRQANATYGPAEVEKLVNWWQEFSRRVLQTAHPAQQHKRAFFFAAVTARAGQGAPGRSRSRAGPDKDCERRVRWHGGALERDAAFETNGWKSPESVINRTQLPPPPLQRVIKSFYNPPTTPWWRHVPLAVYWPLLVMLCLLAAAAT